MVAEKDSDQPKILRTIHSGMKCFQVGHAYYLYVVQASNVNDKLPEVEFSVLIKN